MFCEKCGNKLSENSKFCTKCGEKITVEMDYNTYDTKVASLQARLLNLILDYIGIYILNLYFALMVFAAVPRDAAIWLRIIINLILGGGMSIIYYTLFEFIWQKTPAKFITKTKVIMADGKKPDFIHILGRTLCRFIPFEIFSFLKKNPIGWHDRFSGTLVVPDSYVSERDKIVKAYLEKLSSTVSDSKHCQFCGADAPVKYNVFYSNIGMVFFRVQKTKKGRMCRNCTDKYFREYTLTNLFLGWWGIISFFATCFFMINNIVRYICSLKLKKHY